jgi:arylsulfatase A-like enzyme
VIVVIDDLGADKVPAFAEGGGAFLPTTPHLDDLAAEGLSFTEAWASPLCSPTRASLLTGLYPHHHGVGSPVAVDDAEGALSDTDTTTLAEVLQASGYATGLFGKWHLGGLDDAGQTWEPTVQCWLGDTSYGSVAPPVQHGFDTFVGFLGGEPADFGTWARIEASDAGGTACLETEHPDAVAVEAALGWISGVGSPFFAMVSFAMPHADNAWGTGTYEADDVPAGCAVEACVAAGNCGDTDGDGLDDDQDHIYAALVGCVDARVGELVAGLPPDTLVVVLGDNGTPGNQPFGRDVMEDPYTRSVSPRTGSGRWGKGSALRSGVRVPLLVAGVPGRGEVERPVLVSDLYATLVEALGVEAPESDGASFAACLDGWFGSCAVATPEERPHYVEAWNDGRSTGGVAALRGERHRLVEELDGTCLAPALYAQDDAYDEVDLYASLPLAAALLKRGFHALDAAWFPRDAEGLVRFCR